MTLFTAMENKGKNMIKNIVFDVGKVLVDFDWRGYMDTLGYSPEVYEKVANATVLSQRRTARRRLYISGIIWGTALSSMTMPVPGFAAFRS